MSDHDQQSRPTGSDQRRGDVKPQGERGGGGGRRRRFQNQQSPARPPEPSFNLEELRELFELMADNGITAFEFERDSFRVRLQRGLSQSILPPEVTAPLTDHHSQSAPHHNTAQASAPQPLSADITAPAPRQTPRGGGESRSPVSAEAEVLEAEAGREESQDSQLHIITSPIVGTFYRSPSPTADPFVSKGSVVEPNTVVCIIEAMKLMNEILAEASGVVEKIFVENGQPVEYGQSLFGLRK